MNPVVALVWVLGLIVAGTCALFFAARADRRPRDADAIHAAKDSAVGTVGAEAAQVVELATELHALGVSVLLEPKEASDDDAFDRPHPDQAAVVLRI